MITMHLFINSLSLNDIRSPEIFFMVWGFYPLSYFHVLSNYNSMDKGKIVKTRYHQQFKKQEKDFIQIL